MTRRVGMSSLFVGLGACCLAGCFRGAVQTGNSGDSTLAKERIAPSASAVAVAPSPYHVQQLPPFVENKQTAEPVAQAHFPDDPIASVSVPSVKPADPAPPAAPTPEPETPTIQAEKAPPESPLLTAFRSLIAKRPADAVEALQTYDAASREMLMTLLPMAARVGDGGIDHSTPQETAMLLEQLRTLEEVLRPRAVLALDRVCFCRKVNGFGHYDPWPDNHVFHAGAADQRGERMQVYVEVRNFASRLNGTVYETSLGGVVEVRDADNKAISRLDFPPRVDHSQTPRGDYMLNFQFYLPSPLPEGRYTLNVVVKDVLNPATRDAASARASRSLHFTVGPPGQRQANAE